MSAAPARWPVQTVLVLAVFTSSLAAYLTFDIAVMVGAAVVSLVGGALLRRPRAAFSAVAAAVSAVLLALVNVGAKDENGSTDPFLPVVVMIVLLAQTIVIFVGLVAGRLTGVNPADSG